MNQKIIPAISNFKDLDKFLTTSYEYCIIMNFHIGQLETIVTKIKNNNKKVIVHLDLILGLGNDKYAVEYLCQRIAVDGIITIKHQFIPVIKANKKLAILRMFLIDTSSLNKSMEFVSKTKPDYLEVLPAIAHSAFSRIKDEIGIPLIAGGLISNQEDINNAYSGGADCVTISQSTLW